jgi:hypothetical protein
MHIQADLENSCGHECCTRTFVACFVEFNDAFSSDVISIERMHATSEDMEGFLEIARKELAKVNCDAMCHFDCLSK